MIKLDAKRKIKPHLCVNVHVSTRVHFFISQIKAVLKKRINIS